MTTCLFAWVGDADLIGADLYPEKLFRKGKKTIGKGPITRALEDIDADIIVLLSNRRELALGYRQWLGETCKSEIMLRNCELKNVTNHGEIYTLFEKNVQSFLDNFGSDLNVIFHLSPGTPSMHAVWLLLAKTRFPNAKLIQTSIEAGVEKVTVPFKISMEYIPLWQTKKDKDVISLSADKAYDPVSFKSIIRLSPVMESAVQLASQMSQSDLPVLIEGESGTGKELFAKAIHDESPRKNKPFKAINCAALPETLLESELFGHVKGAYTGATKTSPGIIAESNEGTLFLDEIGEMDLAVQRKMLRVLQEKTVRPVGGSKELPCDFRLICATNKDLSKEVVDNRFREDLYYRINVGYLYLPPIRQRQGCLGVLIEHFINNINKRESNNPKFKPKQINVDVTKFLLTRNWKGNVRELENTIERMFMIQGIGIDTIDLETVKNAYKPIARKDDSNILDRNMDDGFILEKLINDIESHYINRALKATNGKITDASKMLGIKNYQTLSRKIHKMGYL